MDCSKNCANYKVIEEVPSRGEVEPDRPTVREPEIVTLNVDVKTRGSYKTLSGNPAGLIVHYTAGRRGGESRAKGTLTSLAKRGLGCLVMDEDGVIYKARNQDFDEVAYHAGKSEFEGVSGMSYYMMGMEIMCAGKLDSDYTSWYGEKFKQSQCRAIASSGRHKGGYYLKYTDLQEASLRNFIIWQAQTNPEFSINWVRGHDEVCVPAGRKTDPGGSLSMPMEDLRNELKRDLGLM
jgi:N-acetylmuramoyl-L-alanine amidase